MTKIAKTYRKDDAASIQAMFGSIAPVYDRGNGLLSFQMHKLWNRQLIRSTLEQSNPSCFLDLCAGTGAISFDYLSKRSSPCKAILVDFCQEMLDQGKAIAETLPLKQHEISYVQGDAQDIPLSTSSVDAVTVAYGIRNVQEPTRCFGEVYRVLKKGGRFGILELTRPKNPVLRLGHSAYLRTVLPFMGRLFLRNERAYRYLCSSIEHFLSPDTLVEELREVGFDEIWQKPMMGGVATCILAKKTRDS